MWLLKAQEHITYACEVEGGTRLMNIIRVVGLEQALEYKEFREAEGQGDRLWIAAHVGKGYQSWW